MGLIGKIREKTGLAVGIIAIALGAFIVGGDFLSTCSNTLPQEQTVAIVNGEKIKVEEYNRYYEQAEENLAVDKGGAPLTESDKFRLKNDAWEAMLYDKLYLPEFERLGLSVTREEFEDMVTGDYTSPIVQAIFGNPEGGEFNKQVVTQFLQDFDNKEPQIQSLWLNYKARIVPDRLKRKYETLVRKSAYTTSYEARRNLLAEQTKAEANILYIPYHTIPDDSVEITDADLQAYLDKNLLRYEQKERARVLDFLAIPITPSGADTLYAKNELKHLAEDFAEALNDSSFSRRESDVKVDPLSYTYDKLPFQLKQDSAALDSGVVFGPFLENGKFKLYKVSDITMDSTFEKHTASHILFKTDDISDEAGQAQKKREAQQVLRRARAGEAFDQLAKTYSDDPGSKENGGDLGEVDENTNFVEPFKSVILQSKKTGVVDSLVETTFGYHIVNITRTNQLAGAEKKYKVATIERSIHAMDETKDSVIAFVNSILADVQDTASFNQKLRKDSTLNQYLQTSQRITKDRHFLQGLKNPDALVQWALDEDRDVGDVSAVEEIDGKYVIAVITGKTEKGTPKLSDVRHEIRPKVRNQLKAKKLLDKVAHLEGTLEERKEQYGSSAQVQTAKNIVLSSNSASAIGQDPTAIGKLFAMQEGQISPAFAGENGVIILELLRLTTPDEDMELDVAGKQQSTTSARSSREAANVYQAIRDANEIEDLRYKFDRY